MSSISVPYVIERTARGDRSYDVFSRLLLDRILFLGTEVNDEVANLIIAQLLFLEADAPGREIQLYINSPGGSVPSGFAIYDTMQHITSPVATTCVGMAASMAAFLLASGASGRRSALPHARIMMHQPWGKGGQGTAADIEIVAKEFIYLKAKMFDLMARHTGQPLEWIEREFDRDRYMSADEAKRFGMIDNVVEKRTDAAEPTPASERELVETAGV
ncbi:MAG TPA: ATP-dependent Clp protease proteolytic subunit [Gemmatimonadaceae bacterium]|jgi:ATP-dependent Clp protease protease subunit|nr:ATP-dependent Clp protease proteolytic subunit [Gemmatimonadaceae bacterium]